MKTIINIVLVFAALISTSVFAQQYPGEYDLFRKEELRIDAQRSAKTISRTGMLKEKLAAAKTYMPNDRISQAYYTSLIEYSEQLDDQKISQKEYYALAQARGERFLAALKDSNDAEDRLQSQQRQGPQVVYVEGNNSLNDAIPPAMFLNKVGQAFSNSYNQYLIPMTTCNSWGPGTVTCY